MDISRLKEVAKRWPNAERLKQAGGLSQQADRAVKQLVKYFFVDDLLDFTNIEAQIKTWSTGKDPKTKIGSLNTFLQLMDDEDKVLTTWSTAHPSHETTLGFVGLALEDAWATHELNTRKEKLTDREKMAWISWGDAEAAARVWLGLNMAKYDDSAPDTVTTLAVRRQVLLIYLTLFNPYVRRNEYFDLRWKRDEQLGGAQNYLTQDENGDSMVVLQDFKTAAVYPPCHKSVDQKTVALILLIINSDAYKQAADVNPNKRYYVFGSGNKTNMFRDAFKLVLGAPHAVNASLLRKIEVAHLEEAGLLRTPDQRRNLARGQGNAPGTMVKNYLKRRRNDETDDDTAIILSDNTPNDQGPTVTSDEEAEPHGEPHIVISDDDAYSEAEEPEVPEQDQPTLHRQTLSDLRKDMVKLLLFKYKTRSRYGKDTMPWREAVTDDSLSVEHGDYLGHKFYIVDLWSDLEDTKLIKSMKTIALRNGWNPKQKYSVPQGGWPDEEDDE